MPKSGKKCASPLIPEGPLADRVTDREIQDAAVLPSTTRPVGIRVRARCQRELSPAPTEM